MAPEQIAQTDKTGPHATRSSKGPTLFPHWPYHDADEIAAVQRVLRSGKVNYWTGDEGRRFEQEFARSCGCRHAIALANGTVALELALHGLWVGPGDEVITTSRTFIASASAAVMRGATPVIADVDLDSQNLTVDTVRSVATAKTKAIIAVHLAGWPVDMDPIMEFAEQRGIKVIEDCAQAVGALYKGRPVGSIGHAAAFSFCQDKILTTGGEGGMLTTNDDRLWETAWAYKDHGKSYDAVYNRQHGPGFRWLHETFGTNWRMTEMQAAIGRTQLRKLACWRERRVRNASVLRDRLSRVPGLRVPVPPEHVTHAYYKFYAFVRPDRLRSGWSRDAIMDAINQRGIPCFSGSCSEIYLEAAFRGRGIGPRERLPNAKQLGETALMFLVHPTLDESHMLHAGDVVASVMEHASRS